ncbi:MAG: hypothetical protein WKF30_00120 [Pyrinomonadaceae bacterium]
MRLRFDAVVKGNPQNWRGVFQRSRILIRRGKLAEAETDLRRIVEAFPRDRVSCNSSANCLKSSAITPRRGHLRADP